MPACEVGLSLTFYYLLVWFTCCLVHSFTILLSPGFKFAQNVIHDPGTCGNQPSGFDNSAGNQADQDGIFK